MEQPPLPPADMRMGGAHFATDEAFLESAVREVNRLQVQAGLTRQSRLLDWGCGAGRLAVGVKRVLGSVRDYHGVDIQPSLIAWAQENLGDEQTRFTRMRAGNARYNPKLSERSRVPTADRSVDVFYAYSVFSHLDSADVRHYFGELARVLRLRGRAVITAFVEDDVEECVENPEGYGRLEWSGPLHCMRYERRYFESIMSAAGLTVVHLTRGQETDGQSRYILRRTRP